MVKHETRVLVEWDEIPLLYIAALGYQLHHGWR